MPDTLHAYPPFRMKKDSAAYYCGMSITSFDRAVERGELPPGAKRTGGTYWLRDDLEKAMLARSTRPASDFDQAI